MPNTPPSSPLSSPDFRRRLQQRYEEAVRLTAQQPCDYARVHELLAECVRSDPGSILYLDALLANLRSWQPKRQRSWWPKWMQGRANSSGNEPATLQGINEDKVLSTEYSVLRRAPEALLQNPTDTTLLQQLAAAAGACDFDEVELRHLIAARHAAPDDPETLRLLARALTRQGRFEEAVGPWFAVLAIAPDAEAAQAVEDLRGSEECIESPPFADRASGEKNADTAKLLDLARLYQRQRCYSTAEKYFDQAQAASGSSLALTEERVQLRLARSQSRIEIARRRVAHDAHPKAQSLVGRFEAEHLRLETEILHLRSERLPGDWKIRVELARRLKLAGNHSGAIQRLEEANRLQPEEPEILVELGECWQHLRQFVKALDYYHQAVGRAVGEAETRTASESLVLARYRAGVLLAAMGRPDEAVAHFSAVVATDLSYKDAQQRLDKLRAS